MTLQEAKAYNAENYPLSALKWLNEITDLHYKEFYGRTCENCKWLSDEVCTNGDSTKCADFPDTEMMCGWWEGV